MGNIELNHAKRKRKQNIQRAVLATVEAAGVIAVALMAPKALRLLEFAHKDRDQYLYRTKSAATRLARKGLITFTQKGGKRYARLTSEGCRVLEIEKLERRLHERQRRWDGEWRVVMFDVPERRRSVRLRLRKMMKDAGFLRIQDSVWVYPYECEEFIALLKAELRIGKDVLYGVISTLENDRWIREHFALPCD